MRWSSLVVAAATAAYAAPTRADSAACAASAEQGQKARAQGKLVDAHRNFLACSAAECPAVVAKDCTTWAAEVLGATPTIVIDAKDESGHDVGDATLTIDGNVITHQLDGKAIAVDVGSHRIEVARRGSAKPVAQTLIAKEGEKARRVGFVLPAEAEPATGSTSSSSTSTFNKVGPWVLVGLGGAFMVTGIILHLTASYPPGCDADTQRCTRTAADGPAPVTAGSQDPLIVERGEEAGDVRGRRFAGTLSIISGGALATGGLMWFLLARPSKRAMIAPWYDVASGGLTVRSAF